MSYTAVPTRTSANVNASADVNQLQENVKVSIPKAYNIAAQITGAVSIARAIGIPSWTRDGKYWLEINAYVTMAAVAVQAITIAGVTFIATHNQVGVAYTGAAADQGYLISGAGDGTVNWTDPDTTGIAFISLKAEITAWPTWADAL